MPVIKYQYFYMCVKRTHTPARPRRLSLWRPPWRSSTHSTEPQPVASPSATSEATTRTSSHCRSHSQLFISLTVFPPSRVFLLQIVYLWRCNAYEKTPCDNFTLQKIGPSSGSRHSIFSATCLDEDPKKSASCVLKRFSGGAAEVHGGSQSASQLKALRKACHIMCSVKHPNVMQMQVPRARSSPALPVVHKACPPV